MREDVIGFINRFTNKGKRAEVIYTFTNGCCYWFAQVLMERFYEPDEWRQDIDIMYDDVMNHFGCKIDGIIYDITGDVTDKYNWKPYSSLGDDSLIRRIERDCIMFTS